MVYSISPLDWTARLAGTLISPTGLAFAWDQPGRLSTVLVGSSVNWLNSVRIPLRVTAVTRLTRRRLRVATAG